MSSNAVHVKGDDSAALRVAVFGGSFNPPHVGHVLAAAYALSIEAIDRVLVVPVFRHPFSKELAPFDDRLRMCELAFRVVPQAEVSDVERRLGGDSLTLRTLERLREDHPSWSLRLVLGSDVVADLPKWHRFDRIRELAPPLFLQRAGSLEPGLGPAVLPEISSTAVRAAMRAGDRAALARTVPRAVVAHALAQGLYGAVARESG